MTEVVELNEVTKELLKRITDLKRNIKESMMHGEVNILKGIVIFEVILKELNPSIIDGESVGKIEEYTRKYLSKKEEEMQQLNKNNLTLIVK